MAPPIELLHSIELLHGPPIELLHAPPIELLYGPPIELLYGPPIELLYGPPIELLYPIYLLYSNNKYYHSYLIHCLYLIYKLNIFSIKYIYFNTLYQIDSIDLALANRWSPPEV